MVVALPPRSQKAPSAAVLMLSAELMLPRRSPPPRRRSLRRAHAAASCRGCDAPASRPKLRPDLTALSAAPLRTRTSDQQSHAALRERPRRESFVALSSQHEGRVSARRGPPSKIPVAVLTLDPDRGTTPTCGSRESIESDPSFLVSTNCCIRIPNFLQKVLYRVGIILQYSTQAPVLGTLLCRIPTAQQLHCRHSLRSSVVGAPSQLLRLCDGR